MSFLHTINSHGLAALPPGSIDASVPAFDLTVRIGEAIRTLHFTERGGLLRVEVAGHASKAEMATIEAIARRTFRLDDDLSEFYARLAGDPLLEWARCGAGRMLASTTVFEDVVRTICTTNCAWSATQRMIGALVTLGDGAFPSPEQLANTPERWFAGVARMGYRGPYVREIARRVASGELDLERLLPRGGLGPDEVEAELLALPGIGPYAAAHIMQLLGYCERLILDSWTRPTYLRKMKKKQAKDSTIRRTFAKYGRFAGLAFWLYLTTHWHGNSEGDQGDESSG